jgi:SAM-dependent methyltransferase
MDVSKERDLIQPGVTQPGGVWADFGSGTGIFTLVLRELVGPNAEIYSIDKNAGSLDKQRKSFAEQYPDAHIHYLEQDFTKPLTLPPLDGVVMANALHFIPFGQQEEAFIRICSYLNPERARLILVEYDTSHGRPWIPYPVDYEAFINLAEAAGLVEIRRVALAPSVFSPGMYAALGERRA